jgi:hypothetical protein
MLSFLASLNNGRLNVLDLIYEAIRPKNELHKYFDWDGPLASERLWRMQALDLIERCTVKLPVEPFADDPD